MPASDDPNPKPGPAPVDPTRVPRPPRAALASRRDAIIARLQDAVGVGHLELDELDERLVLAMRAQNDAELDVLITDLPPLPATMVSPAEARHQRTEVVSGAATLPAVFAASAPAYPPLGRERLTAVFSGIDQKGRRTLPREIRARALFGGISLDLREATFQPGVTVVRCLACFGGVDIVVPPHVRIEVDGTGVFGGFDGDESDGQPDALGTPSVLRVVGKAVFGGVSVSRKDAAEGHPRALPRRLG